MLTAPRIQNMTQWENEYASLNAASQKLFDEIFVLLHGLSPTRHNNYKSLWLSADRGTFEDMGFSSDEDACEYFDVDSISECRKAFERSYPDNKYWFELVSVEDEGFRHLRLDEWKITLQEQKGGNSLHSYDWRELLSWIKSGVQGAADMIRSGVYKSYLEDHLPIELRYGIISRAVYWRHNPDEKKQLLKDLTDTEIQRFVAVVERNQVPQKRIPQLTFNQYFDIAALAFHAVGLRIDGATNRKLFDAYGEDFGGRIFDRIDLDSPDHFERYRNGEWSMGGHPWGLRRGSSRTRLMLYPIKDEAGYYFQFSGNPNWTAYEIVKMYLALFDKGIPIVLSRPKETVQYLLELDTIGIVPQTRLPIYCQLEFPEKDIQDFRHFYPKIQSDLKPYIEWLPIEVPKWKGDDQ